MKLNLAAKSEAALNKVPYVLPIFMKFREYLVKYYALQSS